MCPLQRLGTKTEVAEGALFLASPLSSFVTGSNLLVDGGERLYTLPYDLALKSML